MVHTQKKAVITQIMTSKAAKAVADGTCDKGVVVCGTGIGVSITANKVNGIRCSLCHDVFSAKSNTST